MSTKYFERKNYSKNNWIPLRHIQYDLIKQSVCIPTWLVWASWKHGVLMVVRLFIQMLPSPRTHISKAQSQKLWGLWPGQGSFIFTLLYWLYKTSPNEVWEGKTEWYEYWEAEYTRQLSSEAVTTIPNIL